MATSKSPLGERSVPKPKNQGSAASTVPTQKPRVQSDRPGGHGSPPPQLAQKQSRRGYRSNPTGGSGSGSRKGDSLPR